MRIWGDNQSKCEMNVCVTFVPLNCDKKRRRGETEAEALICFCWLERQSVDWRECSWPQQTDPHKHFEFSNNPSGHQVQDHLTQQARIFFYSEYRRIFKQYENFMYSSTTNTNKSSPCNESMHGRYSWEYPWRLPLTWLDNFADTTMQRNYSDLQVTKQCQIEIKGTASTEIRKCHVHRFDKKA